MSVFIELSVVIIVAAAVASVMRLLRQPLVVGYIISGIIIGPYFLDILRSHEYAELLSKMGLSILLFIVGLSLSPRVIRELGKISLLIGIGQVIFTSIIGFFIVRALGFGNLEAVFISVALTLSSTIIIMKLLSDKGDLEKLYGRVTVGILLVQDIFATILLLAVSAKGTLGGISAEERIITMSISLILLAVLIFLSARYILPKVTPFFASSQELLFLFSIAWGLGLSSLFFILGFSFEIGALIAGVALSVSPFAHEISSRLKPLRDFFILLFFILLGATMSIGTISEIIAPAIILSLFIFIGNPLIVFLIMNLLKFKRRTAFMAGLTVAQISEFSLILMALANAKGFASAEAASLVTLVGLITIAGSTYLILYGEKIYEKIEWLLRLFEIRKIKARERMPGDGAHDILLFGYDRVGSDFVRTFRELGSRFLVVDHNPASIKRLQEDRVPHAYGDAEDAEFLNELGLHDAKLIVSTIPDFDANALLVKKARERGSVIVIVISHDVNHAHRLYDAGATYVLMPHYLGAEHAVHIIEDAKFDSSKYEARRMRHLNYLYRKYG